MNQAIKMTKILMVFITAGIPELCSSLQMVDNISQNCPAHSIFAADSQEQSQGEGCGPPASRSGRT